MVLNIRKTVGTVQRLGTAINQFSVGERERECRVPNHLSKQSKLFIRPFIQ